MNRSEKKLRDLSQVFSRNKSPEIAEAIKTMREGDPFEGAIGVLASFYNETGDRSLRKLIEGFFNDLKDQSARPEVMAEIRKPWKPDTISMIVASCWQSGLDYSDYLNDLAEVFLNGDYAIAIECMTVIEESIHNSTREKKDEIIKIIEASPLGTINEKSALTLELISILER